MKTIANSGIAGLQVSETNELVDMNGDPFATSGGGGTTLVDLDPAVVTADVGKLLALPSYGGAFSIYALNGPTVGQLGQWNISFAAPLTDPLDTISFRQRIDLGASSTVDAATWRAATIPTTAAEEAALLAGWIGTDPTWGIAFSVTYTPGDDFLILDESAINYSDMAADPVDSGGPEYSVTATVAAIPAYANRAANFAAGVLVTVDELAHTGTMVSLDFEELILDPTYGPYPVFDLTSLEDAQAANGSALIIIPGNDGTVTYNESAPYKEPSAPYTGGDSFNIPIGVAQSSNGIMVRVISSSGSFG
jgi:hypothetical protein